MTEKFSCSCLFVKGHFRPKNRFWPLSAEMVWDRKEFPLRWRYKFGWKLFLPICQRTFYVEQKFFRNLVTKRFGADKNSPSGGEISWAVPIRLLPPNIYPYPYHSPPTNFQNYHNIFVCECSNVEHSSKREILLSIWVVFRTSFKNLLISNWLLIEHSNIHTFIIFWTCN